MKSKISLTMVVLVSIIFFVGLRGGFSLKIDVHEILRENGAHIELDLSERLEDLDMSDTGCDFDSPVAFKGMISNVKGILKLTGRLKLDYTAKCYRCLKEVKCSMDIGIEENFVKSETEKDDESYLYEGDYIEIDKPLKDNILLELPMKHVCEEECRGICPKCGCDLNSTQCDCTEESTDPRLEGLKDFFKN